MKPFSSFLAQSVFQENGGYSLKIPHIRVKGHKEVESKIHYFTLQGLLPSDQKLVSNQQTRTLSLLSNGPEMIMQQQLSINELRVISPILESFPHYCPYEVLLSYIYSNNGSQASVERCRQRLQDAQNDGTWQQELRPLRRALTSLRNKLQYFGLTISNVRERGCSLTSLESTQEDKWKWRQRGAFTVSTEE